MSPVGSFNETVHNLSLGSCLQAESAEYLKEIDSLAMEFDKQQDAIKALVADVSKREEVCCPGKRLHCA